MGQPKGQHVGDALFSAHYISHYHQVFRGFSIQAPKRSTRTGNVNSLSIQKVCELGSSVFLSVSSFSLPLHRMGLNLSKAILATRIQQNFFLEISKSVWQENASIWWTKTWDQTLNTVQLNTYCSWDFLYHWQDRGADKTAWENQKLHCAVLTLLFD